MPFDLPELLGPYLLPLLMALPLAVVLFLIGSRRGDDAGPAALAAAKAVEPAEPSQAAQPAALLVVDDSAVARAKLGRLLEGAGYQVTLAKDGLEALERLAGQRYQLLITDLEMPNKDGFELIADVQGNLDTEDLPIIAITGHEDMQARVHQVQGLYGIFQKPWNDRELLKRVATLTRLRQP